MAATSTQATATPTAEAALLAPTGAAAAPASCPIVVNMMDWLRDDVPKGTKDTAVGIGMFVDSEGRYKA